ncbi:hypothetical protein [Paraclostridium sordellii]|uniref:hypothetical protein n=1 Tax=Paraclostridium sordellii TaxID=1505 RepID=UPI0005E8E98A|nr:hypothetical protein [Paeniclostridium sordellii]CEN21230.1 Uncharacterised protein [[Clostridium] sordellii] [Paeniclostridium sordellii]
MEIRTRNVSISKVGGNASKNSKRASIGLPMPWLTEMGVDEENREVKLIFEGNRIILEKAEVEENEK